MSVGASPSHNVVRYQDESFSECKCLERTCVVCNPNPTTDLIFGALEKIETIADQLAGVVVVLGQHTHANGCTVETLRLLEDIARVLDRRITRQEERVDRIWH